MKNTVNQLADIVDSYTVFEENQVLTHEQLNGLVRHLDGQHRLSRVLLAGVGLACGLAVDWDKQGITISRGCGITSDGDLLALLEDTRYTYYRPFADSQAKYPLFRSGSSTYKLYELIESPGPLLAGKGKLIPQPLSGLSNREALAVLLYSESYEWDPDICTGGDCDNLGRTRRNNLRALLIAKSDLTDLLASHPLPPGCYHQLADIIPARVKLTPSAIEHASDLAGAFATAIKATAEALKAVLPASYTACRPLLAPLYPNGDPTPAWLARIDELSSLTGSGQPAVYRFLCDICQAYMEFKESLFEQQPLCSPDITLFPKHLMLGAAQPDSDLSDPLRHPFYPSPLHAGHGRIGRRLRFLHQRLDALIANFAVPAAEQSIRITPSKGTQAALGDRAIPYYYQITQKYPIHRHWSFEHAIRQRTDAILSYHAAEYSTNPMATLPLDYDLSPYPFFRIEGHQGWEVAEAEEAIAELIAENNLPISLVKLQVENNIHILPYIPKYPLRELKSFHRLFRRDLKLQLDNLRIFNAHVKTTFQEAQDGLLPTGDLKAPQVSYRLIAGSKAESDQGSLTDTLDAAISTLRAEISKPFVEFEAPVFETNFQAAAETAAAINKGIRGVSYTTAFTPYETMVTTPLFRWMGWIGEIVRKREEKAKELSLFGTFLEAHPGMEHLGGVPAGGTLVLVYSSLSGRVVADFALPYRWGEPLEAEEADEPLGDDDTANWNWHKFNDHMVYLDKAYTLEGTVQQLDQNIVNLSDQFSSLSEEFELQKASVLSAAGSVSNYMQAVVQNAGLMAEAGVAAYQDETLGYWHQALDQTRKAAEQLDKKETLTAAEEKARQEMDATMAHIIKASAEYIGARESDITAGSEEEQYIEAMGNAAATIKDETTNAKLAGEIETISNNAASVEMVHLSEKLNTMMKR